jgi:hypothetical protein
MTFPTLVDWRLRPHLRNRDPTQDASFGCGRASSVPGTPLPPLVPVTAAACAHTPCHFAKTKDNDGGYEPSGYRRLASHAAFSAASVPSDYALCSHEISDESTEHSQSGRQALAFTGRRSLVAVAGCGCSTLSSACYVAGAVVGRTWSAGAVPSAVAVVASVRLALLAHHRLVARIAPARVARLSRMVAVRKHLRVDSRQNVTEGGRH